MPGTLEQGVSRDVEKLTLLVNKLLVAFGSR